MDENKPFECISVAAAYGGAPLPDHKMKSIFLEDLGPNQLKVIKILREDGRSFPEVFALKKPENLPYLLAEEDVDEYDNIINWELNQLVKQLIDAGAKISIK